RTIVFAGLLVAMMIWRPEGLLPSRQRRGAVAEGAGGVGSKGGGGAGAERGAAGGGAAKPTPPAEEGAYRGGGGAPLRSGGGGARSGVAVAVRAGEISALSGPTGAGKTTIFKVVTGVYRRTSGSVQFDGRSLEGLPPHRVTKRGLARTFQNIRLFHNMSAL